MSEPMPDEIARWAHEGCREWIDAKADRCGQPSIAILWGKLFDAEALGPRCEDHVAKWLNGRYSPHDLTQWAVFDLRPLPRLLALVAAQAEQNAELRADRDQADYVCRATGDKLAAVREQRDAARVELSALRATDEYQRWAQAVTWRDAVKRVQALHQPYIDSTDTRCCGHDGDIWPCPTITALDGTAGT